MPKKLNKDEVQAIIRAVQAHEPTTSIAARLVCARQTVSRIYRRETGQSISAYRATYDWSKAGAHE